MQILYFFSSFIPSTRVASILSLELCAGLQHCLIIFVIISFVWSNFVYKKLSLNEDIKFREYFLCLLKGAF